MGDLKTPFDNAVISTMDPAGDDIPSRGSDPNVDLGGSSGLKPIWDAAPVSAPDGQETANSVSGLPLRPSRLKPSPEKPPMPPTLNERSPTTIDEK